jgi:hypothetical protein
MSDGPVLFGSAMGTMTDRPVPFDPAVLFDRRVFNDRPVFSQLPVLVFWSRF